MKVRLLPKSRLLVLALGLVVSIAGGPVSAAAPEPMNRVSLLASTRPFTLAAEHSGLCLDLPGWSTADGERIQQYDCNTGTNQQWSLVFVNDVTAAVQSIS